VAQQEMAQYRQKYRRVMKEVNQWSNEDIGDLHSLQPSVEEFVRWPVVHGNDVSSDHSGLLECSSQSIEDCSDCSDTDCDDFVSDDGPLNSSTSEDDMTTLDVPETTLQSDLAQFMVSQHLTRSSCNELLAVLRKHGLPLPKDSRTLRKTPRNVSTSSKCGGQYVYFGVKKVLRLAKPCDVFRLKINIDGVPLHKSTNKQFWPILCQVNSSTPAIVALFLGTSKPNSLENFLEDFIEEMEELHVTGFDSGNSAVTPVILHAVICDAPARAFTKNIAGHTSLNACERCLAVGLSVNNRVTFAAPRCFTAEKRSHDKFVNLEYHKTHQNGPSPLCRLLPDCISAFPLDYMHLVCLGAVRRMMQFWKKGGRLVRLSSQQVLQISEKLVALRSFIPSDFVRRPRSLTELDRWKATEFRQFLLYTGPVVLKTVLEPNLYQHFVSLSVSISILLMQDNDAREQYLEYACKLLHHYVANCERIYGENFLVYNIHSLLHLGDDARFFRAPLDELSSFPFENYLQTLKRLIRSTSNPIAQVVKRVCEYEAVQCSSTDVPVKQHKLGANGRDSVVFLKSGRFAEIVDKTDDHIVCDIYKKSAMQPLYLKPCSSDLLNIVYIRHRAGMSATAEISVFDIERKAVKLPHGKGFVFMPLLHKE